MPPRNQAWTGPGVVVEAEPDAALRDGDLVTAVDGVALGDWDDRRAPTLGPAFRPGDRPTAELLAVADQTMQPTPRVSLWLRPQGHRRR